MPKTQIKDTSYGQIQNNNVDMHVKSPHKRNTYELERGKSVLALQPGYEYPIMFKEVLAGETIETWKVDNITRLITPLVPTLDNVYVTIKAFFVPHTRVWADAEKALASKYNQYDGNTFYNLPYYTIPVLNTTKSMFRDTLIARYGLANGAGHTKINALLPRGYRAIINDFIRNKEYESPSVEWKETTIVSAEQQALMGFDTTTGNQYPNAYYINPSQTRKGYLTNIFSSISGDPDTLTDYSTDYEHLDWEQRFRENKQRIANANKNDWDIIAEMGGTQPVRADRVEFLGKLDYELNYQQITQSTPSFDDSSPLGTTGSFSYTRADGTIFSHKHFQQHGFIHILLTIQTDKGYEEGTPKELLKIKVDEIYRPALAKKETQLMYSAEIANNDQISNSSTVAFQPPWAEYKRLPKLVTGSMRSKLLDKINQNEPDQFTYSQWHNFPSLQETEPTIYGSYFRPVGDVISVIERNNILVADAPYNNYRLNPEFFFSMSIHNVSVSSPIQADTIKDVEFADVKE